MDGRLHPRDRLDFLDHLDHLDSLDLFGLIDPLDHEFHLAHDVCESLTVLGNLKRVKVKICTRGLFFFFWGGGSHYDFSTKI